MSTSSVTQKGQVTVPADMRAALGLKTGSKVVFRRHGEKLVMELFKEKSADSLFGTFRAAKGQGVQDIDVALEGLRRERLATTKVQTTRDQRKRSRS